MPGTARPSPSTAPAKRSVRAFIAGAAILAGAFASLAPVQPASGAETSGGDDTAMAVPRITPPSGGGVALPQPLSRRATRHGSAASSRCRTAASSTRRRPRPRRSATTSCSATCWPTAISPATAAPRSTSCARGSPATPTSRTRRRSMTCWSASCPKGAEAPPRDRRSASSRSSSPDQESALPEDIEPDDQAARTGRHARSAPLAGCSSPTATHRRCRRARSRLQPQPRRPARWPIRAMSPDSPHGGWIGSAMPATCSRRRPRRRSPRPPCAPPPPSGRRAPSCASATAPRPRHRG